MATVFPGGLSELAFVEAYWRSALRKPQMAADAALRQLVFAEAGDRAILTGLIGQELTEACRRLTAVWGALSDRTHSVAATLLKPLPGVEEWVAMIQRAATLRPDQVLWDLNLDQSAMDAARMLRAQPDLAELTEMVAAAASGGAMLLIPGIGGGGRNIPTECWFAGPGRDGEPIAASFGAEETDAANLADLTADLCSIARGFLGAYLGARKSAGWRGE
jgi:hypothetical protein